MTDLVKRNIWLKSVHSFEKSLEQIEEKVNSPASPEVWLSGLEWLIEIQFKKNPYDQTVVWVHPWVKKTDRWWKNNDISAKAAFGLVIYKNSMCHQVIG